MAIVLLYNQNKLYRVQVSEGESFTVGSGKKDKVNVPNWKPAHMTMRLKAGVLCIKGQPASPAIPEVEVAAGRFEVLNKDAQIKVFWNQERETAPLTVKLPYSGTIRIGRATDNDVILSERVISSHHCTIRMENSRIHLMDGSDKQRSTNGTYLNCREIERAEANPGDCIDLVDVRVRIVNMELRFENADGIIFFGASKQEEPEPDTGSGTSFEQRRQCYHRSPRIREELPMDDIVLKRPPSKATGGAAHLGSLVSLLSSSAMLASSLAMGVASPALLAARAASMVSPVSMLIHGKQTGKKEKQQAQEHEEERQSQYVQYIEGQLARIKVVAEKQKEILNREHPSPALCKEFARNLEPQLWERSPEDLDGRGQSDFLDVRMGMGYDQLCVAIKAPMESQSLQMDADEMEQLTDEIVEVTRFVDDVPARVRMGEFSTIGIVGNRQRVIQLVQNMIISITALHYSQDVKIVGLFDAKEKAVWGPLRWLPHVWDEGHQSRYLAFSEEDVQHLCDLFNDLLKERAAEKREDETPAHPHYVFILGSCEMEYLDLTQNFLLRNAPKMGITTLFLFDRQTQLPRKCRYEIDVGNGNAPVAFEVSAINRKFCFSLDEAQTKEQFDAYCRSMAAIEVSEASQQTELANSVTFLQGYGVNAVAELKAGERWEKAAPERGLRAPFAVVAGGKTFDLDVVHDGPHGLVAGTTRSGKSELLASWLLSMAVNYSPYDVTFVIIDYKGGGLPNSLNGLPHLVGQITNLGSNIDRMMISLYAEVLRRQRLFAECRVKKIDDYIKGYRDGQFSEPLPRLLIVADEFRELREEQPEFLKSLISVATIGASLGVHLVLATQNPAGIVDDQIRANTNFQICLRVLSAAASRDMIGRADAAKITKAGRAYVKVGADEVFEQVQSFWCGAPYQSGKKAANDAGNQVRMVLVSGQREKMIKEEKTRHKSDRTESLTIAEYLNVVAEQYGYKRMECPWKPELPERIVLRELEVPGGFDGAAWGKPLPWLQVPLGKYDMPSCQAQGVQYLNFETDGHYAIYGGSGTGKTTMLKTILKALGVFYTPEDVQIYILDYGGGTLQTFDRMPHVGGVALEYEEEKTARLKTMLLGEIEHRRETFRKYEITTLKDYRRAVINGHIDGERVPAIVLAIDNFASFLASNPGYEELILKIVRDCAAIGIYLVYTANNLAGIPYKLHTSIKSAIMFEPADKNDYTIVGKPQEHKGVPTLPLRLPKMKGRGYFKDEHPIEFQAALYAAGQDEYELSRALRAELEQMDRCWHGKRPQPVAGMPDQITAEVLLPYYEKPACIPVGLSTDTLEPVYLDLRSQYKALLTGTEKDRCSSMLCSIAGLVRLRSQNAKIYAFDSSQGGLARLRSIADCYASINDREQVQRAADELFELLLARDKELKRAKQEQGDAYDPEPIRQTFSLVCVLIDDLNTVAFQMDVGAKKKLEAVIQSAKGLGVIVLAAAVIQDIIKNKDDKQAFYSMHAPQNGLVVSGTALKGKDVFGVLTGVDLTEGAAELKAGTGLLCTLDGFRKIGLLQEV